MITPTWNDMANSPRWHGVVGFIRNWVGPFDSARGMSPDELADALQSVPVDLPAAVREWYLLAANWEQGGLNVWIRPHALTVQGGLIWLLTDTQGINHWGVRVTDLGAADPPLVSLEGDPNEIDFLAFTSFVAAMIVNDVIFGQRAGAPAELDPASTRADLTCLVSARCGNYFADATLESARIVAFAYPGDGPAFGMARTTAGSLLLERLRHHAV